MAAVVLAAGAGFRAGGPKALLDIGGETALRRVVATCRAAALDTVVVVAGAHAEAVLAEARAGSLGDGPPVQAFPHPGWAEGRTSSLQAGWRALPLDAHVLVFPVDHPAVALVTLDLLLGVFGYAAASPEAVLPVVTDGAGRRRRGHPVLLSSALRARVLALGPDEPLHAVVHEAEVLEVPVDDLGILVNVNTPEDAIRAAELIASRTRL